MDAKLISQYVNSYHKNNQAHVAWTSVQAPRE